MPGWQIVGQGSAPGFVLAVPPGGGSTPIEMPEEQVIAHLESRPPEELESQQPAPQAGANFMTAQGTSVAAAAPPVPAQASPAPQGAGVAALAAGRGPQAGPAGVPMQSPMDNPFMQQVFGAALRPRGGAGGPVTRQTQTFTREGPGRALNPEVLDEVSQANLEVEHAQRGTMEAERQGVARLAAHQDAANMAAAARQRANEALEAEEQQRVGEQMQRVREAQEAASRQRVDPDSYWARRGSGARTQAAIAVALGQFGAALTGTRNAAMDIIQAEIQRDLDVQQANLAQAHQEAEGQRSLLGDMLRVTDNQRTARAATEATLWGQVAREAEAMATHTQDAVMQQRAQELSAAFRKREADSMLAAERAAAGTLREEQVVRAQSGGGGGGGPRVSMGDAINLYRALNDENRLVAEMQRQGLGTTRVDAQELAKRLDAAGVSQLVANLNELADLGFDGSRRDLPGRGLWDSFWQRTGAGAVLTDEGRRASIYFKNMIADFLRSKSGATVTDQERAFLTSIMDDPLQSEASAREAYGLINRVTQSRLQLIYSGFGGGQGATGQAIRAGGWRDPVNTPAPETARDVE